MAAKLHNISDMTKQFSFFYFNYSTFLSSALTPSNFSRCKGTTFPTPQFPKRHESAWTCELLRLIATYLVHRFPQINFLGTEIHGFIFHKGTAWLRIDIYPRHFVITACFASSRLSFILQYFNFQFIKPCLYFSIALMQIKPFPSRSPAVSFLKAVSIRA